MKDNIQFKIKLIIGALAVLLVVVLVGFGSKAFGSQEKKLSQKLEVVGKDFYENMYFNHITANKSDEEVEEFFTNFTETGIKVDLDNLSRFDEEKYPKLLEEFVNKKTKEACHVRTTKAIIYPEAPFGKTDYTLDTELDCGFNVE